MTTQKVGKEEPLVGLSLRACINDILAGIVEEGQVTRIVASTNARTREEFEQVLEGYTEIDWHERPEEAKSLARRFYEAGKIDQPCTRGGKANQLAQGHWRRPGTRRQFNIG